MNQFLGDNIIQTWPNRVRNGKNWHESWKMVRLISTSTFFLSFQVLNRLCILKIDQNRLAFDAYAELAPRYTRTGNPNDWDEVAQVAERGMIFIKFNLLFEINFK